MAVINLAAFASSLPIATRSLTILLLVFTLTLALLRLLFTDTGLHVISFSRSDSAVAFPWLVIVPGSSFWYPWTLVTAAFCETAFFEFLISIVTLPLAGRYLERIWGPVELVRFAAIVTVTSNIIAWFLSLLLYAVTRGEQAMYGTQYHGLEALQTGFLVALTQLIPEHQLQFKFGVKVRVRDLPMAYVTLSNVLCLLGITSPFILIQFGWLISWAYLRFFKMNESGIRGDRSETFSFVSWFPPFLHKPVTIISNFLYGIFLRLGVVKPWQYSAMGDLELGVGSGLPSMSVGIGGTSANSAGATSTTRAEAERRRAMALKALDQRVKAGSSAAGAPSSNGGAGAPSSNAPQSTSPAITVPATAASSAKSTSAPQAKINGSAVVPTVVVQEASEDGSPSTEVTPKSGPSV